MSVLESRWVDLDGPTHYVDFGGPADGPRVVLVHGLGGSLLNWLSLAPRLTATCRVLALDLAGHGRTQPFGRSTSVRANAKLLRRFIEEVAGGPAVVVGNSMGGLITLLLAERHPEVVAGAVLVDPALPQLRRRPIDLLVAAEFAVFSAPGLGELFMLLRRRAIPAERQVRQVLELCCADPAKVDPEVVRLSLELAHERSAYRGADAGFLRSARTLVAMLARASVVEAAMGAVRAPVLLVHGDRDRLVAVEAARRAARQNPGWRYEELAGVGHVPQLEAPERTADILLDWLATEAREAAVRAAA